MTKQDLQKELKEKVKAGIKLSDLKKLKRSKSADDIPSSPAQSIPLTKSKSSEPIASFTDPKYPYTTLIAQAEELEQLKKETQAKSATIALLRQKIEKLESAPPRPLLQEQLNTKQKELEGLRKQLETTNTKLTETTTELDNSLTARYETNKQFTKIYDQFQQIKLELCQETDTATDEIISQDKQISTLRNQKRQAKLKIQELERDLSLSQRLAELRKDPFPSSETNPTDFLPLIIFFGATVLFTWLVKWLTAQSEPRS